MRMVVGGVGNVNTIDSQNADGVKTTCTSVLGTIIETDTCKGRTTI